MSKFKMRDKPVKPVREDKSYFLLLEDEDKLKELIEIFEGQGFSLEKICVESKDEYCCSVGEFIDVLYLTSSRPETDEEYNLRLQAWKIEDSEYQTWCDENKEDIAVETAKEMELATARKATKRKRLVANLKRAQKELDNLDS